MKQLILMLVAMTITASAMAEVYEKPSPTMGKKPPRKAIVLLDKKSGMDQWAATKKGPDGSDACRWTLLEDGVMEVKPGTRDITSRHKFKDMKLHLEFRSPIEKGKRGQGAGNSGLYFQGRYEVQVLASHGNPPKDNECGGIYKIAVPQHNMCAPAGTWQTYDVEFTAAKWDDAGKKTANARITVKLNGVLIHDNVELPRTTTACQRRETPEPEGLFLQDHSNKVQYRNIWVAE